MKRLVLAGAAAAALLALAGPASAQFVGPYGYGPYGYGGYYGPQPYYGPYPYAPPVVVAPAYGYAPYGYRPYHPYHDVYGRYAARARNQSYSANGSVNADDNLGLTTNGPLNTAAH